MASFSFGAGNAAKIVRAPLSLLGRLATLVIPRSRDRWVFGCGAGIGDGALALWRVAERDAQSAVWLTGSARDAADARAAGIPSVPTHSIRGFWETARARVVVVTHGFGDVNRYAIAGAFIVQLWHGIPLKRIGLDSPETTRTAILPGSRLMRRVLTIAYRSTTRRIDILPAASHLVRARLESAFSLDDARVPVTGEPRVDVLSAGDAVQRREHARAGIERAVGSTDAERIVLYAPTWRDGQPDPAIPTPAEWAAIQETLARHDAILLIRSHPLGEGAYEPPVASPRVRLLDSETVRDVTPLLPAVDLLVTDYSSIAFDASLVPVPTVWFAPDEADYAARRGFYGAYSDVAGPDPARTWTDVLRAIERILSDPSALADAEAAATRLSSRVHAFRDGSNTARVYGVILARTGLAPTHAPTATAREAPPL